MGALGAVWGLPSHACCAPWSVCQKLAEHDGQQQIRRAAHPEHLCDDDVGSVKTPAAVSFRLLSSCNKAPRPKSDCATCCGGLAKREDAHSHSLSSLLSSHVYRPTGASRNGISENPLLVPLPPSAASLVAQHLRLRGDQFFCQDVVPATPELGVCMLTFRIGARHVSKDFAEVGFHLGSLSLRACSAQCATFDTVFGSCFTRLTSLQNVETKTFDD